MLPNVSLTAFTRFALATISHAAPGGQHGQGLEFHWRPSRGGAIADDHGRGEALAKTFAAKITAYVG